MPRKGVDQSSFCQRHRACHKCNWIAYDTIGWTDPVLTATLETKLCGQRLQAWRRGELSPKRRRQTTETAFWRAGYGNLVPFLGLGKSLRFARTALGENALFFERQIHF